MVKDTRERAISAVFIPVPSLVGMLPATLGGGEGKAGGGGKGGGGGCVKVERRFSLAPTKRGRNFVGRWVRFSFRGTSHP